MGSRSAVFGSNSRQWPTDKNKATSMLYCFAKTQYKGQPDVFPTY